MIESFLLVLWGLWALQATAGMLNLLDYLPGARRQESRWRPGREPSRQRRAVVVVPVKHLDPDLGPAFFRILLNQDYAAYRIVVTMEHPGETSAAWLSEALGLESGAVQWRAGEGYGVPRERMAPGLASVSFVYAGRSRDQGQKVHNQLAALALLEPEDRLVVLADADMQCGHDWLARLCAPVNSGTHPTATTYRWLVPRRPTLPNLFGSAINAGVATLGGREVWNMFWGGSTVMAREDFDALDVPRLLRGSLNDDLRLGREMRLAGRAIAGIRTLIVPSDITFSWTGLFEFGCRQYYQMRHFSPLLYKVAQLCPTVYTLAFVTALPAAVWGNPIAPWVMLWVFACDQVRAAARWRVVKTIFPPPIAERLRAVRWVEHFGTPVSMALHASFVWTARFMRSIRWAGIRYRVLAPDRTLILDRSDA